LKFELSNESTKRLLNFTNKQLYYVLSSQRSCEHQLSCRQSFDVKVRRRRGRNCTESVYSI